jgi:hypothetical protein
MNKTIIYLFVDIDGVFIREDKLNEINETLDENGIPIFESACIQAFTNVVSAYEQIKIVISSSWKETFDYATITSRFPESIRNRIEGITPSIWSFLKEIDLPKYVRHQEVLEYLRTTNATDAYWIAIDDLPHHYPPNINIVATNPYVGFDDTVAIKLVSYIEYAIKN